MAITQIRQATDHTPKRTPTQWPNPKRVHLRRLTLCSSVQPPKRLVTALPPLPLVQAIPLAWQRLHLILFFYAQLNFIDVTAYKPPAVH